jgi:hypothetical protein
MEKKAKTLWWKKITQKDNKETIVHGDDSDDEVEAEAETKMNFILSRHLHIFTV